MLLIILLVAIAAFVAAYWYNEGAGIMFLIVLVMFAPIIVGFTIWVMYVLSVF